MKGKEANEGQIQPSTKPHPPPEIICTTPRYYSMEAGDQGIYHAAFWQAEEAKAKRATAKQRPKAYHEAMAPLREQVGEALSKLGVRKVGAGLGRERVECKGSWYGGVAFPTWRCCQFAGWAK